jgi:LemA protein
VSVFSDIILAVTAVIVIIAGVIIAIYNGFVTRRNRIQDAWAQIDVQLKRRYDLIPNLVETVKGYMKYEKGVLTQITQLRASIISGSVQDKAVANNQLSAALKSLFAVAENYPDLKASETYKNLQDALEDTEDKIAFVRTSYNDYVLDYNNAIQQFPGNLLSGTFGFSKCDYFQAPEEEREAVKVDLTTDVGAGTPKPPSAKIPAKKGKSNK